MNDIKIVDGWEIVPKSHVVETIRDITVRDGDNGLEQDRLVSILEDLFTHAPDEISYYFSEEHSGQEGFMDPEDFYDSWDLRDSGFNTVYNSALLNYGPESGYNIIGKGYGDWNEKARSRNVYISVSLNGCSLASALTEYYKFTILKDHVGKIV